jgi:hypothetical protein
METKLSFEAACELIAKNRLGDLFKQLIAQMQIFNKNTNFIENDESLKLLRTALISTAGQNTILQNSKMLGIWNANEVSTEFKKIAATVLHIMGELPIVFWGEEQLNNASETKPLADTILNPNKGKKHDLESNISIKLAKHNKDYSVFNFMGIPYNKGRLVNAVIREYVRLNPNLTYADLEKAFPKNIQGSKLGVFVTKEQAEDKYEKKKAEAEEKYNNKRAQGQSIQKPKTQKRYKFTNFYDLINLNDCTIATCDQWGILNIQNFIDKAESLNPNFRITKT